MICIKLHKNKYKPKKPKIWTFEDFETFQI